MVRRVLVSLCLVALVASAVGYAATTGRMNGTVQDNDGLPLPGVTVQIASDNLIGGAQVAITGGNGSFSFAALPVGMYTVEASLVGFQGATGQVRVNLDSTASVAFTLVPEQFGGEIEVVASVPVVDTAQVNTQQVFDQDFLQNAAIGATGRSYQSVVGQAAGVGGGSNPNVFGGVLSDNNYLIDGVSTHRPADPDLRHQLQLRRHSRGVDPDRRLRGRVRPGHRRHHQPGDQVRWQRLLGFARRPLPRPGLHREWRPLRPRCTDATPSRTTPAPSADPSCATSCGSSSRPST